MSLGICLALNSAVHSGLIFLKLGIEHFGEVLFELFAFISFEVRVIVCHVDEWVFHVRLCPHLRLKQCLKQRLFRNLLFGFLVSIVNHLADANIIVLNRVHECHFSRFWLQIGRPASPVVD